MAATAAQADESGLRCFKVQSQRGTVEQVCESAGFVTIASQSGDGDAQPSPAVLRAHALKRWMASDDLGPQQQPYDPTQVQDWSGVRGGLGPWGALSHAARPGGLGLDARISADLMPSRVSPVVVGLVLDQTGRPASTSSGRPDPARALTSLDLKLGYVIRDRFVPYLMGGVAGSPFGTGSYGRGINLGVGLSYALDDRWALNIDYRHTALFADGADPDVGAIRPKARVGIDTIDALLLYRFL